MAQCYLCKYKECYLYKTLDSLSKVAEGTNLKFLIKYLYFSGSIIRQRSILELNTS